MKHVTKAFSAFIVAVTLNGCVAYSPDNPKFQALRGKEVYGQVNSFFTSIDTACNNTQNFGSPYCAHKEDYVWIGALVGQKAWGGLQKSALAVPKSANVQKGDIIAYHLSRDHTWGVFDKVAARATDQTSSSDCRWDGSHFGTGGVVCDGWRWDRDYPLFAD